MNDSMAIEERALKTSTIGAFILAVWGLAMALVTASGAIMLDGSFNLITGVLSFLSIVVTRFIADKPTDSFPVGYFALESLVVFVKGTSVLILIIVAVWSNLTVLLSGGREPMLGVMTVYVIVAVVGCLIIYTLLRRALRKTESDILIAETQAWLANAVISGAIGLAFVVALLIQNTSVGWITRYVDQILVIIFGIILIRDPFRFILAGLRELLLSTPQREYAKPFTTKLQPLQEELGLKALALDVIKTGRRLWLTVRVDPHDATVNVDDFMQVRERLRVAAREVYENTETEVILERLGTA